MSRFARIVGGALAAAALALAGVASGVYIWDAYTDHGTATTEIADEMLVQLDRDLVDQVYDEDGIREAEVDVDRVTCVRTAAERAACLAEATVEGEESRYRYVVDIDRSTGNWVSHAE